MISFSYDLLAAGAAVATVALISVTFSIGMWWVSRLRSPKASQELVSVHVATAPPDPDAAFQQEMRWGIFDINSNLSQILSILRPTTQKSLISFLVNAGWMTAGALASLALAYTFRAYLNGST